MANDDRDLTDEGFEAIAGRFKVLSDPVRLKILHRLQSESTSVGELARITGTSQPNISKHLALLRAEGLVERTREEGRVCYSVSDPSVFRLCETVCDGLEAQLEARSRPLFQTADE